MKKMKKLAALVLAMVMAFSCMMMPAMAHGHDDEGIMPMKPWMKCPECGTGCEAHNIPGLIDYPEGCKTTPWPHSHACYFKDSFTCPTHGTFLYGLAVETPCSRIK